MTLKKEVLRELFSPLYLFILNQTDCRLLEPEIIMGFRIEKVDQKPFWDWRAILSINPSIILFECNFWTRIFLWRFDGYLEIYIDKEFLKTDCAQSQDINNSFNIWWQVHTVQAWVSICLVPWSRGAANTIWIDYEVWMLNELIITKFFHSQTLTLLGWGFWMMLEHRGVHTF